MSGLPWFKCYPQDLLRGMAGMPADERGIYISVLCLLYSEGGPVRDEPRQLAYQAGCTVKQWVKLRAALVLHGKLKVVQINGRDFLSNERCEQEIEAIGARSESFAERGSRGGKKRAQNATQNANENNGDDQANASPSLKLIQADTEVDIDSSVVPPDGETTGAPLPVDPNGKAWADGVALLVSLGGMKEKPARAFFGQVLSKHRLQPRDLLGPIGEAFNARTSDPQGYLTKAAQNRSSGRRGAPEKRVGFV